MDANGTSSTQLTSICAGPTAYRPPSFTRGWRHNRNDTVMSPEITASRSSRLNSMTRCYGGPPGDRSQPSYAGCENSSGPGPARVP